jgi:hypothetical protein
MKSAVQRNDLSPTVVDEVAELVGLLERREEGSAGQDNLKVARFTNLEADMDKPVSKFKLGRFFDVENGVKISGRHSTPRGHATTEPDLCAVLSMNVNLQRKLTREFTKSFCSLPAQPLSCGNGSSLQTPSVERPTISDREF